MFLDEIPLDQPFTGVFQLCGLPDLPMVFGLSVQLSSEQWDSEWEELKEVWVDMRITDSKGGLVVDHSGFLGGGWTWSGPYPDGAFLYEQTTLKPVNQEQYELSISVVPGSAQANRMVLVSARGGGWK